MNAIRRFRRLVAGVVLRMKRPEVAIIGAGMAGIACAAALRSAGCRVVVFEKSRGRGGRCATRRDAAGHRIDHGAQYFTLRDPDFAAAVRGAGCALGEITAPIVDASGGAIAGDARWYHVEGNSRLAGDLGAGLEIRTGVEVGRCESDGGGWLVAGERFDNVVSTAPLPQTRRLFGLADEGSGYVPCLTLVAVLDGLPRGRAADCYAIRDDSGHAVEWTACENHKAGRVTGEATVLVTQASEGFSRAHLEDAPDVWRPVLLRETLERWGLTDAAVTGVHTHRWRYARVGPGIAVPALPAGAWFAGDALTASRVESAWRAGRDVAAGVLAAAGVAVS